MLNKIIDIMRDVCEIEDEVTLESRFVEDFGISSLEELPPIEKISFGQQPEAEEVQQPAGEEV